MSQLTFKERLHLYKLSKKPRKQIRLQLKVITHDLFLPVIQKCDNKVQQVFKIKQINKIQPHINHYGNRYQHKIQSQKKPTINQNYQKLKNQYYCMKFTKQNSQNKYKINCLLKQIEKDVQTKSHRLITEQIQLNGRNTFIFQSKHYLKQK